MHYAICTLATVAMRKQPDLVSEMVSQLLFGEHYLVLEEQPLFQKVRSAHDGYEGWITTRQGEAISKEAFQSLSDNPPPILRDLVAPAQLDDRQLHLVRGSHMPAEINGKQLTCAGKISTGEEPNLEADQLEHLAIDYLHTPYLWGGRSPFGIDCSGFTQMIFKFFNHSLPRDSREQVKVGRPVFRLSDARPGDLAFFFEKTAHVGLITSEGILHASSSVRHDALDENGICDRTSGEYSHELTCIRRIFED